MKRWIFTLALIVALFMSVAPAQAEAPSPTPGPGPFASGDHVRHLYASEMGVGIVLYAAYGEVSFETVTPNGPSLTIIGEPTTVYLVAWSGGGASVARAEFLVAAE